MSRTIKRAVEALASFHHLVSCSPRRWAEVSEVEGDQSMTEEEVRQLKYEKVSLKEEAAQRSLRYQAPMQWEKENHERQQPELPAASDLAFSWWTDNCEWHKKPSLPVHCERCQKSFAGL